MMKNTCCSGEAASIGHQNAFVETIGCPHPLASGVTIAARLVSERLGASVPLSYGASATCGLCAGFLSGLPGIGGALVVVSALYLLLPVMGVGSAQLPYAAIATASVR